MTESWHSFLQRQGAVFDGESVRQFGNRLSTYSDPKDTVFSPVNWLGVARVSGSDAANFLQAQLNDTEATTQREGLTELLALTQNPRVAPLFKELARVAAVSVSTFT